jgi:hypothetical protein
MEILELPVMKQTHNFSSRLIAGSLPMEKEGLFDNQISHEMNGEDVICQITNHDRIGYSYAPR